MPTEFPELATLSTEELTELLCDEAKYTAFVQSQAARAHIIQAGPRKPLLYVLFDGYSLMELHWCPCIF